MFVKIVDGARACRVLPLVVLASLVAACGGGGGGGGDGTLPTASVACVSVLEGNSGTTNLVFTVTLSGPANGNVTVDYATSDGTAAAGSDYTATSGTLTIVSGTTSNTITVPVTGDTTFEPNETLTLTLSNLAANAAMGTAAATGTLVNDDAGGLNDTGITACADGTTNGLACPRATHPGQDAEHGRDANPLTNSDADGHAGFSFTKLDASGNPLADQSADYATTPWACVRDNVTGLVWEVKTDDGGLHDKDWYPSWYNSNGATNGGNAGEASGGYCGGTVAAGCDTEKFVAAVNTVTLCGYDDWRLPTAGELVSLVDSSIPWPGPAIDTTFFPNTLDSWFWSSSPYAGDSGLAWYVDFKEGDVGPGYKYDDRRVRLVRAGQ